MLFVRVHQKKARRLVLCCTLKDTVRLQSKWHKAPSHGKHWDFQVWFLGKPSKDHLNILFSWKLEKKLFNSATLSTKLTLHIYSHWHKMGEYHTQSFSHSFNHQQESFCRFGGQPNPRELVFFFLYSKFVYIQPPFRISRPCSRKGKKSYSKNEMFYFNVSWRKYYHILWQLYQIKRREQNV